MAKPYRFIDLFAGIGGIRIALELAAVQCGTKAQCVFSSEYDPNAQRTYREFFGDEEIAGDITQVDAETIPDFDILAGGFPCQPFSLAGVSKKESLGRKHGFEDPTQGTLFFDVANILRTKKPRAFLLENVRNLLSHDRGKTIRVIRQTLTEAGYAFTYKVISAITVVPQLRPRIYIVGQRASDLEIKPGFYSALEFWAEVDGFINAEGRRYKKEELGLPEGAEWPSMGAILQPEEQIHERFGISEHLWAYHQAYKEKHRQRGNGFGYGIVNRESPYARTLSARYYKDGAEILVERVGETTPRRLTPYECALLQGFPMEKALKFKKDHFAPTYFKVSNSAAYKQFGNSVPVPVVTGVAKGLYLLMTGELRLDQDPELFLSAPDVSVGEPDSSANSDSSKTEQATPVPKGPKSKATAKASPTSARSESSKTKKATPEPKEPKLKAKASTTSTNSDSSKPEKAAPVRKALKSKATAKASPTSSKPEKATPVRKEPKTPSKNTKPA